MGAAQFNSRHDGWCKKHDAGVEQACSYCSAPICSNCILDHTADGTPGNALKQGPYYKGIYDQHQTLSEWQRLILNPVPAFLSGQSGVHIGLVGASGTGKSSFINAIRGLKPSREGFPDGWAEEGSRESTEEPTKYEFPGSQGHLWIWDLPGGETSKFPAADYTSKFGLPHFSILIILFSTRLTELGEEIINLMTLPHCTVTYFLVRSFFDVSWPQHKNVQWDNDANKSNCTPEDIVEAKNATMIEVKHEVVTKCPQVPVEDKLFVLSLKKREGDWEKFRASLAVEFRKFFSGPIERTIFDTEWTKIV